MNFYKIVNGQLFVGAGIECPEDCTLYEEGKEPQDLLDALQQEVATDNFSVFKTAVQSAIDKTDLVALRCWKAGIEFPIEWKEYTVALRALLSSDIVIDLPAMPKYPVGS